MSSLKKLKPIHKSLLILVLILILSIVGVAAYKMSDNLSQADKQSKNVNSGQEQNSTSPAEQLDKTNSDNNNTDAPSSSGNLNNLTLNITSFTQSGGIVRTSAIVNSSQSGTCYFNFTSSNTKSVSRTSTSQLQGTSQLCVVEVSEVEFTKLGPWNLYISFTQNNGKVETTKDVNIN